MSILERQTLIMNANLKKTLEEFLVALYQESDYQKAYSHFSKLDRSMNSLPDYMEEMKNTFWARHIKEPIFYSILSIDVLEHTAFAKVELKYNSAEESNVITLGLIDEEMNNQWSILYNWEEDERRKRIWPGPK